MGEMNQVDCMERESSESSSDWIRAQDSLKASLLVHDDFDWRLGGEGDDVTTSTLKYVAGVDLSFSKDNPSVGCGALVVMDITRHDHDDDVVVYENYSLVKLHIPYIPGLLAFREAPVLLELLDKMRRQAHPFFPQLLMVDGNGLLHPRGFGLACHVGVLANLPTIGVGKNLHHVDGLTQASVRQLLEAKENTAKDLIPLTGCSGRTWGVAMRTTGDSLRPIYVSVGHRIALDTAAKVVKMACKYRVPEPIRQADIRSRAFLQKRQFACKLSPSGSWSIQYQQC